MQFGDKNFCADQIERRSIDKDACCRSQEPTNLGTFHRSFQLLLHTHMSHFFGFEVWKRAQETCKFEFVTKREQTIRQKRGQAHRKRIYLALMQQKGLFWGA
ncbi:hypothetical protein KSX_04230 [Ktedonospora formicarum]|uniref:Uncharacterized protein n=1 Tax=Ktedonospora formicarum TaxID=2778364 RepID=A0A8J3MRH6_9CHLR|nr:hypothetical protein KSX_04230 [Ktedonospora formicarum]